MSISKCRSCGASIIWMQSAATGKNIPVDFKPELEGIDSFNAKTMVSHFATCPQAGQWRKKKAQPPKCLMSHSKMKRDGIRSCYLCKEVLIHDAAPKVLPAE